MAITLGNPPTEKHPILLPSVCPNYPAPMQWRRATGPCDVCNKGPAGSRAVRSWLHASRQMPTPGGQLASRHRQTQPQHLPAPYAATPVLRSTEAEGALSGTTRRHLAWKRTAAARNFNDFDTLLDFASTAGRAAARSAASCAPALIPPLEAHNNETSDPIPQTQSEPPRLKCELTD